VAAPSTSRMAAAMRIPGAPAGGSRGGGHHRHRDVPTGGRTRPLARRRRDQPADRARIRRHRRRHDRTPDRPLGSVPVRFPPTTLTPRELELRARIREFLAAELPPGNLPDASIGGGHDPEFSRKLAKAGFVGLSIPASYG